MIWIFSSVATKTSTLIQKEKNTKNVEQNTIEMVCVQNFKCFALFFPLLLRSFKRNLFFE